MPSHRTSKVASQIKEEIMRLVQKDVRDPRIGFFSIVAVKVSPDLRYADIKISLYGTDKQQQATLKGLESAKPFLRRELSRRLENLKFAPELRFIKDESIMYSIRISQLIKELHEEKGGNGV